MFSTELNSKETSTYEITSRRRRLQILIFYIFLVYFQRQVCFSWIAQPFRRNCIAKEELHGIDLDDIGNVEDLPGIVFTHEECGNLKVFVDGGELARNINTDR